MQNKPKSMLTCMCHESAVSDLLEGRELTVLSSAWYLPKALARNLEEGKNIFTIQETLLLILE